MLKLASQLARGAACRTVAEAHDQVAARAQRAAECRHDKIRAIADAAVDAAAKGFSHEKLALIDLASVKQDAIDHAMVTMAAAQEAAKKAAAGEMAAAEAAAASSMSAGPAAAKTTFVTAALLAVVTEARSKMRAADAQPISESAIIEHANKVGEAVQSASEDNDEGKTVMSAPGGALAVDKPQKKDSAVCLAEAVETVGQNPAEDIAAAVTPRIATSVATEAIGDAGRNTGRSTTDAASIATASNSVGTSGACAAAVGRPNGSSDPIGKNYCAIKIAAECDHLALIKDIHHFSSGAFAWYDLQISDDDWNEVVQKYSRPLTSKDLV
nr:hypothetical protein HK105_008139 [Polyrhizophydium stewartii]